MWMNARSRTAAVITIAGTRLERSIVDVGPGISWMAIAGIA
jgi:hypothetical protein